MADESNTDLAAEVTGTDVKIEAPAVKKTRAPRRQKNVAEAIPTVSEPATAKSAGPGRGRKANPKDTKVTDDMAPGKADAKQVRQKAGTKPATRSAKQAVSVSDDMADLIQLEEENKRLRKALAEKLRLENGELRKRLGVN